jgi:hypothetical protein
VTARRQRHCRSLLIDVLVGPPAHGDGDGG